MSSPRPAFLERAKRVATRGISIALIGGIPFGVSSAFGHGQPAHTPVLPAFARTTMLSVAEHSDHPRLSGSTATGSIALRGLPVLVVPKVTGTTTTDTTPTTTTPTSTATTPTATTPDGHTTPTTTDTTPTTTDTTPTTTDTTPTPTDTTPAPTDTTPSRTSNGSTGTTVPCDHPTGDPGGHHGICTSDGSGSSTGGSSDGTGTGSTTGTGTGTGCGYPTGDPGGRPGCQHSPGGSVQGGIPTPVPPTTTTPAPGTSSTPSTTPTPPSTPPTTSTPSTTSPTSTGTTKTGAGTPATTPTTTAIVPAAPSHTSGDASAIANLDSLLGIDAKRSTGSAAERAAARAAATHGGALSGAAASLLTVAATSTGLGSVTTVATTSHGAPLHRAGHGTGPTGHSTPELTNIINRILPVPFGFIPSAVWAALVAALLLAAIGLGTAFFFVRRARRQASQMAEVAAAALTDPLTGVLNRRGFTEAVERELARSRRYARPFVLAYADVRGLKRVNDSEGHLAGDELLKGVASLLDACARAHDVVGRLGGDEFGLLLPEQSADDAAVVTERIREQVCDSRDALGFDSHWDLTVGFAAFPRDGETAEELVAAADRRLYEQRGIELAGSR